MPSPRHEVANKTPALCEYAGRMLKLRLERMLTHCGGVRDGNTTEPVHQMRVWSRRTRAALEVFTICFQERKYTEMEREIKRVADSLGETRDLDVMMETLTALAARLPANQRSGVDALVDDLRSERSSAQHTTARAVARLERCRFDSVFETAPSPAIKIDTEELAPVGSTG